jgi:hypothetical protein
MKLLGLLITLAIIGYAMSTYMGSSGLNTVSPDGSQSKPKDYIDKTRQSVDTINQSLKKDKERLDSSN